MIIRHFQYKAPERKVSAPNARLYLPPLQYFLIEKWMKTPRKAMMGNSKQNGGVNPSVAFEGHRLRQPLILRIGLIFGLAKRARKMQIMHE